MSRIASPFAPLDATSSGLNAPPPSLEPLRQRMAAVYGVDPEQVRVVRGPVQALEILIRRSRLAGFERIMARPDPILEALCALYGIECAAPEHTPKAAKTTGFTLIHNPQTLNGKALTREYVAGLCVDLFPCLVVVDEALCDICPEASLIGLCAETPNLIILRDLGFLYGLEGAQVGCLIGQNRIMAGIGRYIEPSPLATPSIRAAEAALDPSRHLAVAARIALITSEKHRLNQSLAQSVLLESFDIHDGPSVFIKPRYFAETETLLKRAGVTYTVHNKGFWVAIGESARNDRLLLALKAEVSAHAPRRAEIMRDTKETRIAVTIDLDQSNPRQIETGNGFFDHMLDQVATHGGFSLIVGCEGDHHIDAHHAIEDVMLAFGAALKQGLGDLIGMARFGFVLPMDETEASVSIDLGGRPFCVFKGDFSASHIGDFPTQMVAHAFRSLSETLGAAIHVSVGGANDHHMAEACFKALGRALRQAIRIEGGELASSKGMLA